MITEIDLPFDRTFANEFKYWFKDIFRDKMNFFIPIDQQGFVATRIDKNAQDKRDMADILPSYSLDYDAPVHYLEITTPLKRIHRFYDCLTLAKDGECLILNKNLMKNAMTPLTRLHTLYGKLDYKVPEEEVFAFKVIRFDARNDQSSGSTTEAVSETSSYLVIEPTPELEVFISYLGKIKINEETKVKPEDLKDAITRGKAFLAQPIQIGHIVSEFVAHNMVAHYAATVKDLNEDQMVDYVVKLTYDVMKKHGQYKLKVDDRCNALLGQEEHSEILIPVVVGWSHPLSAQAIIVAKVWAEGKSLRMGFKTTDPDQYICVSLMPNMLYYMVF